MNKKILILSLVAVAILTIPVSTAVDINTDGDNELRENTDIGTLDNNEKEIFSKIDGSCLDSSFYGIGVFFNVEIWATSNTWITIVGYTSLLPPRSYTVHTGKYVKVPIFIGYTFQVAPAAQTVHGIAFGDIEWS